MNNQSINQSRPRSRNGRSLVYTSVLLILFPSIYNYIGPRNIIHEYLIDPYMLNVTDQTKVINYILSRNGQVYGTNELAYRGFPTGIYGLLSRQLAIPTTNSSLCNLRTRYSIYECKLFLPNTQLATNPL